MRGAEDPVSGRPRQDVKKLATGKGNAKKVAMLAAANERWRLQLGPKDENAADARWIAEAAAVEFCVAAAPALVGR